MPDVRTQVDEMVRRLRRVRTSTITVGVLSSILLGLGIAGASWLVVSLLDMGLGLAGSVLRVLAVFLLVSALAALAYHLVKVFSISHSIKTYAARVGAELKEIGLDILTALDLSGADHRRLGYSEVLIARVIDDISRKVRGFDLQVSVRKKALLAYSVPLAAVLLAGALWRSYDPATMGYSLNRLGFLWGLSAESGIAISVKPGDDEILAGTALEVTADVTGFVRKTPILHILAQAEETAYTMERADSLGTRGHAHFASTLPRVDRDLSYFVSLADQVTPVFRISVYEEPRIKDGSITLEYPAYTGLGQQMLPQGIWDVTAPFGTNLVMELRANCRPESAWVDFDEETGGRGRALMTVTADSMCLRTVLRRSFTYSVHLVTGEGEQARPHGPHSVTVVSDQDPYVRIESPAKEIMLEADMIVPLSVVALDDYGISKMTLHYACPVETAQVELPYQGKTQARSDYSWDTARLNVVPGDLITYYVRVADNDALKGPKYAQTETYLARVPTLYDFYQEIEEEQQESIDNLDEIAQEARDLKEEFEDLTEEMKRTSDAGWEEEQAIKQNLAEQEQLRQRIEEIAESLDQTLDKMGENRLVSFEIIEKMEEIRRLFEEVATDEMKEALDKLREAMEQLSPEEIRAAMEDMNLSQEELLMRLERTLEMLKRLQLQQKMEALVNLAQSIAEGQNQITEQLQAGADLGEMAQRQEGLSEDARQLEQMMEELANLLEQQGNPLSEDIAQAGEFMRTSQIGPAMSMAQGSMSQGQRDQATEQSQTLEPSLTELVTMLRDARDALVGEDRRAVQEALTKAMYGLRDVSAKHEEVISSLESTAEEMSTAQLARMEMTYKEALDRIAEGLLEASRKSLFVSPILGKAVLRIGSQLGEVSGLLSQGIRGRTRGDMKSALGSMNQLITGLMDAMDKASSCSSPSGMCEAFQSLESMCCMQMGINQGSQSLLSQGQEGLSMEARAQMSRLAAEQDAVRKGIDDLAGEYGGRAEILGRLDDLAQEARRVVEDLRNQNLSEETIKRQEQILTRLLNAQRSMRRRDYSERRKSRPGQEYEIQPPPELSQEERQELMQDLLYQRRGYYPPEYEELIRAYFRAIAAKGAGR